jgi:hypothetical protein
VRLAADGVFDDAAAAAADREVGSLELGGTEPGPTGVIPLSELGADPGRKAFVSAGPLPAAGEDAGLAANC